MRELFQGGKWKTPWRNKLFQKSLSNIGKESKEKHLKIFGLKPDLKNLAKDTSAKINSMLEVNIVKGDFNNINSIGKSVSPPKSCFILKESTNI